jgi:septum formation protein
VLVLASSSPRRRELLSILGVPFTVQSADIDESPQLGETPLVYAARLAQEKARVIAAGRPADRVLGADTIVILGNEVLGKPQDAADARRMLRALSGKVHQVSTAVCLVINGHAQGHVETTNVFMGEIADAEIDAYVASGEPLDKAGAYAIQGGAAKWVYRIEGDYFNVVGLPVSAVWQLLQTKTQR